MSHRNCMKKVETLLFILSFCISIHKSYATIAKKHRVDRCNTESFEIEVGGPTVILSFEDQKSLSEWGIEAPSPSSITLSNEYARYGRYSGKFELNITDVDVAGSKRCEMKQKGETKFDRWFKFSQLFPASFSSDPAEDVVGQWHDIPDIEFGETWRVPPIGLTIKNDSFFFHIKWASTLNNSTATGGTHVDGQVDLNLGKVEKEKWVNWVFHIVFSYRSDGVVEVWKNGVKVIDRKGPNSYNDKQAPYFKFGIYKWQWKKDPKTSNSKKRIMYYDEVEISCAPISTLP